jgi:hypothetical protein
VKDVESASAHRIGSKRRARAMSERIQVYSLTPVGYLIVEPTEHKDPYGRKTLLYRGVDRVPLFLAPDDEIRRLLGAPLVENEELRSVLEEWYDARSDLTRFMPCAAQAMQLLESFHRLQFRFELLFCRLAWTANEAERVSQYAPVDGEPLAIATTYGFDVSWPTCNHSAIWQPGVVPESAAWQAKLNRFGLLDPTIPMQRRYATSA